MQEQNYLPRQRSANAQLQVIVSIYRYSTPTMPSTTGALRSSCVLTSKCDTELQAETRCHDAVEPLLFPTLLHGMRNKNYHTCIYEYQDRLPKKTAPYHDVEGSHMFTRFPMENLKKIHQISSVP